MVKYLNRKNGAVLSEENKMELENLRKLVKKYERLEKNNNDNNLSLIHI